MLRAPYTNRRQQASTAVKVDPTVQILRTSRLVMLFAGAVWLAMVCIGAVLSLLFKQYPPSSVVAEFIFWSVYFVFMLPYQIWLGCLWKRLEQRRQAAARGDMSWLVADQPYPDAFALSLPVTIKQRVSRSVLLLFGVALLVAVVVIIALLLIFSSQLLPFHHLSITALIVIAAIVFFIVIVCFSVFWGIIYAKARQQLTVTESGLIVVGFGQVHSVSWGEARLFAIDGIPGARRYPHPALFELSSANDIVRWNWWRRSSLKLVFAAQPMLPQEEYDQQMRALLSLIAARTSLPLHDLREKPAH